MNKTDVTILTIGMNHKRYIISLLKSLFVENKPRVSFEMIYVDNCSDDGSVEYIRKYYPEVKIIINQEPKGFGENNNIGVQHASGEYIAIVNPDIILLSNSIDYLFQYAKTNQKAGIVVPELLNIDGTHQYSVRNFISPSIFFYRLISRLKDDASNKRVERYLCKDLIVSKMQKINWAFGAMFFISKAIYDKLDGFDTDYFLYMEDEDFCLRCWENGYPVIYYPKSKMIHNHLRASSQIGKKSFLHFQSLCVFFKKHGFFIPNYALKNT